MIFSLYCIYVFLLQYLGQAGIVVAKKGHVLKLVHDDQARYKVLSFTKLMSRIDLDKAASVLNVHRSTHAAVHVTVIGIN